MRGTAAFLASSLACGAVVGCSGAASTDLLAPGGNADDGGEGDAAQPYSDGGGADASRDGTSPPVDAGTSDTNPVVDSMPPPMDTSPPPPGVPCGAETCPAVVADCCVNPNGGPSYECQNPAKPTLCTSSGNVPVFCDEGAQCPGAVCCGQQDTFGNYIDVRCRSSCNGTMDVIFCDPTASTPECPTPMTCMPSSVLTAYYVCQ